MRKLTVTVITYNEAHNLPAALQSVGWADEVIVVDRESTDGTADIARSLATRVIVRPWPGYSEQKNFAAELASHDWILSLDADERVPASLAAEIRACLEGPQTHVGYRVPRVTWHLGRWIRSTDWYPDYQLRLYDRRHARWAPRRVHESVVATGPIGTLAAELQHLPYRNIEHHLRTMDRYTTLAAEQMLADGRRAGWLDVLVRPRLAFLRNFVLRRGFKDGMPGLIVSSLNAQYVGLKFAKLWELCSPSISTPPAPGEADSNRSS